MIYIILGAAGLLTIAFFIIRGQRKKIKQKTREIENMQIALKNQIEETERREHIIKTMQEVNADAEKKKREIRNNTDPVDRSRAATDIMSELSRNHNRRKDDPPAGD